VKEKELQGDSGFDEDPIQCLNCKAEIPEENRDPDACTETCPKCGQVQRAIP